MHLKNNWLCPSVGSLVSRSVSSTIHMKHLIGLFGLVPASEAKDTLTLQDIAMFMTRCVIWHVLAFCKYDMITTNKVMQKRKSDTRKKVNLGALLFQLSNN